MQVWKKFLADLGEESQLVVVGPLLNYPYSPKGPTIFVDGATQHRGPATGSGGARTITVGDNDSSIEALDVVLPKKKDYSDLAFVLRTLPPTVRHIELLGFLGGRRDHELVNFGEAHDFLREKNVFSTVRFDDSIVAFAAGKLKLEIRGEFSLIVFEKCEVTITGACAYPLKTPTVLKPVSSHGLSNVGAGQLVFAGSRPCFLFLTDNLPTYPTA